MEYLKINLGRCQMSNVTETSCEASLTVKGLRDHLSFYPWDLPVVISSGNGMKSYAIDRIAIEETTTEEPARRPYRPSMTDMLLIDASSMIAPVSAEYVDQMASQFGTFELISCGRRLCSGASVAVYEGALRRLERTTPELFEADKSFHSVCRRELCEAIAQAVNAATKKTSTD